jgi:hypothetical protein
MWSFLGTIIHKKLHEAKMLHGNLGPQLGGGAWARVAGLLVSQRCRVVGSREPRYVSVAGSCVLVRAGVGGAGGAAAVPGGRGRVEVGGDLVSICVHAAAARAACPGCRTWCTKVHSQLGIPVIVRAAGIIWLEGGDRVQMTKGQ